MLCICSAAFTAIMPRRAARAACSAVIMAVIVMSALVVMAGAMLVIGLPFRRPFRKLNDFFEAQLEKTGYM